MSAFSEQRAAIRKALVSAGLDQDAATSIANILGNSLLGMRHAGAVEIDTTPSGFDYVSPEDRKVRFPNLDATQDDPDHRPSTRDQSERRRQNEQEPNVVVGIAPQETDGTFRVAGGALTDVVGRGDAAIVNVRSVVAGMPPAGLPLAMLSPATNQIVGKAPRAQVNDNDGTARLDIQETDREVLWNLQMTNRSDYDVVTDVRFVEGVGLQVKYARIKAWDMASDRIDTVPTVDTAVVESISEDKNGLRATRKRVPVFGRRGLESQFLNTFRIGTFTGGWPVGEEKTVRQLWPQSLTEQTVKVMNLTTSVPNTSSTKHVLYAVRTKDVVPDLPDDAWTLRSEPLRDFGTRFDVNLDPIDQEGSPEATYYAIEIQAASDCVAFSSLNGKLVSDLTGYTNARFQLLAHGTDGCLQWLPDANCGYAMPAAFFDDGSAAGPGGGPQVLVNVNGCAKWVATKAHTVVRSIAFDGTSLKYSYDTLYALPHEPSGTVTIFETTTCPTTPSSP